MAQLVEDDVRLLRQRLVALEQGRLADAEALEHYLRVDREVSFEDLERADAPDSFLDYWAVPSSVGRMSLLLDYGREPIFRIPQHMRLARPFPVGCFEVPDRVPPPVIGAVRPEGFWLELPQSPVDRAEAVSAEPRRGLLDRILGR